MSRTNRCRMLWRAITHAPIALILGILCAASTAWAAPYNPAYLIVSGNPSPDSTGIYAPIGDYNGDTLYARQSDSAYYIWRSDTGLYTSTWTISAQPPTGSWSSHPYWSLQYFHIPQGNSSVTGGGASGTSAVAVYDPNNPTGTPVLQPIPTPAAPPQYPAQILITSNPVTGPVSPDVTGVYVQSGTYNGVPVWTRQDSAYAIWGLNPSIWHLSVAPGNTTAGEFDWNYKTPGIDDSTGSVIYSGIVTSEYDDPNFPTPDEYLATLPHPVFKANNTMMPLSRYGWSLSYPTNKELQRWGYALDFGSVCDGVAANLANPTSDFAKLVALAQSDPTKYGLSVETCRNIFDNAPDAAMDHDGSGSLISPKTFSPETSSSVLSTLAASTQSYLQQVADVAPISIVINGGERGLAVYGWGAPQWQQDPAVVAAESTFPSWSDYISQRKTQQEMYITHAVHAVTAAPYVYYLIGGSPDRNRLFWGNWWQWDWDYKYTQSVPDFPGSQAYYANDNTGWVNSPGGTINGDDALTLSLNAIGYASSFGKPLSYNWLNGGYNLTPTSPSNSDMGLYYGFLKTYYTAGMIGGNAGYYSYPDGGFDAVFDKNAPPNWLVQMMALGHVHAEFSYLEDMLRNGDLLPGPMMHRWSTAQPAYEFWTGFYNDRVLVRKQKGYQRWLISAWAADAIPRTVSVTIPTLGTISVNAQPTGTLYDARVVSGVQHLTIIDNGSMTPTVPSGLTLPSSTPDADGVPYPTLTLSSTATTVGVGSTVRFTASPSNLYASASTTKFLANNVLLNPDTYQSSTYTWTPTAPGTFSVVAVVGDNAGNYVTSNAKVITVTGTSVSSPLGVIMRLVGGAFRQKGGFLHIGGAK